MHACTHAPRCKARRVQITILIRKGGMQSDECVVKGDCTRALQDGGGFKRRQGAIERQRGRASSLVPSG